MRSGIWIWISWKLSIELILFAVDFIRRVTAYSLFHSNGEVFNLSPWFWLVKTNKVVSPAKRKPHQLPHLPSPIWNVHPPVFEMSRLGSFLPVVRGKKRCIPISARLHSRKEGGNHLHENNITIFFTPFSAKMTKWEKKVYRVVFLILFLFSTVGSETHIITRIRINIIHKRVCQKW